MCWQADSTRPGLLPVRPVWNVDQSLRRIRVARRSLIKSFAVSAEVEICLHIPRWRELRLGWLHQVSAAAARSRARLLEAHKASEVVQQHDSKAGRRARVRLANTHSSEQTARRAARQRTRAVAVDPYGLARSSSRVRAATQHCTSRPWARRSISVRRTCQPLLVRERPCWRARCSTPRQRRSRCRGASSATSRFRLRARR